MNIASKAIKKTLPSTASVTIGHTTESKRTEAAVTTVGNIAGREATMTVSPASKVPALTENVSPAPKVPEDAAQTDPPVTVAPETARTVAPVSTPASTVATAPVPTIATTPASTGTVAPPPAFTVATAPAITGHTVTTVPAPTVDDAGVAAATESTFEIFLNNPNQHKANDKDAAPAVAAYHLHFVRA